MGQARSTTGHGLVLAVTLACLLPFLGKPFHVDDPLFVWAAQQITSHPLDFYGFPVNWYGTVMRMADVMQNPPLTSYYLAATAGPFGFQEWSVHMALLAPALLAASGTFMLARRFCRRPWLAALAAVLTPVFAISATTAMSDVWMLALWVWATERWIVAIDSGRAGIAILAAAIATLAVLAKYSALCLLPLLWLYALLRRPSWKLIACGVVLPVVALACYQLATARLYGHGLLFAGARYAIDVRFNGGAALASKTLTGLSFMGGCLLTPLALGMIGVSRRTWMLGVAGALVVAAIATQIAAWRPYVLDAGHWRWETIAQLALFVVMGAFALSLVLSEIMQRREDSWFLAAWVVGVFAFTCFLNWTINARALLPMVPAIAFLAARRLERPGTERTPPRRSVIAVLVLGAALCLGLEAADQAEARSAREAAARMDTQLAPTVPQLLFQGHWGFQYYMEQRGATALDLRRLDAVPRGAAVVVPLRNTNIRRLPDASFPIAERVDLPSSRGLTTLDDRLGAGFYSDVYGPLPFVAGQGTLDPYLVLYKVTR